MTYNPLAMGTDVGQSNRKPATNNTGSTIPKATPVRILADGTVGLINPSVESHVDAIAGLTKTVVPNGGVVDVITAGIIEDIATTIPIGSVVYLSKTGGLTDIKPSIGVNGFAVGDWVIRLGVIAKNQNNPVLKDILVGIQVLGQL